MHTGISKNEKMIKIGPGIAKIQRKTSRKLFCLSISAVMYRRYARQLSRAIKRRPHVLAFISAIPGRILGHFFNFENPSSIFYQFYFSASVALTELSVALSFDQLAQEKVQAVVNPQPILSTSTFFLTHCEDFYYIQALLNRLLQNIMSTKNVSELGYLFLTSPVCI